MIDEELILSLIRENDDTDSNEIAKKLSVSISTVRRKLSALEKKGLIKRTHGGAKILNPNNSVFNFSLRIHTNVLEKRLIALKAIKLIKEGDVIFLDGSTSTYFLAEYLNEFKNVTVITNGIDTLNLLANKGVLAISTGGTVSKDNTSVLVGNQVVNFVNTINANICFFSCQSCTKEGLISDCYLEENYIRSAMIKHSDKSVFLCDSTKLNRVSSYSLCDINEIDYTIVEKNIDDFFINNTKCKICY